MNYTVHHPRLQMYYDSAAMNIASLGAALSLVILSHYVFTILPVVALCIFFAFMVGYSIWFWISKPKSVSTSKFLSNVSHILYAVCFDIGNSLSGIGRVVRAWIGGCYRYSFNLHCQS